MSTTVGDIRALVLRAILRDEYTPPEIAQQINQPLKQVRLCVAALCGAGEATFGASRDREPLVRITAAGKARVEREREKGAA